jgi:probable F420-dependent oxidoreductase
VKFGVTLPNLGGAASTDTFGRMARRVEELRFDALFVGDHVVMPTSIQSRYPYRSSGVLSVQADEDVFEPFTVLAFLAGITSTVRLGISVLVLPYRHPVLNAKMLATLDVLSGGRLIVGVGVGWMEEEFQALDADFEHRGAVTDEHIRILKALWTQDDPRFEGNHYRVGGIKFFPKPVQKPHPPVWVGGIAPPALRRAALLGEGWHAVRMTPQDLARGAATVREMRGQHGLDGQPFSVSVRTTLKVTDSPLAEGRTPMTGTPEQIQGDMYQYAQAGADYLVLGAPGRTVDEIMGHIEGFAADVLPGAP